MAKTISRKLEEKPLLAEALYTCADVLIIQGHAEDSMVALEESLILYQECKLQIGEVAALVLKANILLLSGKTSAAMKIAEEAMKIATTTGDQSCIKSAKDLLKSLQVNASGAEAADQDEGAAELREGTAAADEEAGSPAAKVEDRPRV